MLLVGEGLLSDSESLDQSPIAIEILLLDVVEQTSAPADETQKASTTVMILGVSLEMLGELYDSAGQQCNLDFRRAGVLLMKTVAFDDLRLL